MLHDKKICGNSNETIYDNLWNNLKGETCKIISKKETSIIWNIWHITRIEDIVSGIIIGNSDEVLNNEMLAQLNIKKDTENAMDYKEIETLNSKINISALNTVVISVCPQSRLLYGQTLHFLAFRLRKCGF
ncbi:MAG: hypothetical protein LBD48_01485 [Treponema sp.]|nr:hypothetical protein [Treponema sp.]